MRPSIPRPGGRLGPYRLFERLGQGGMGVVFQARHERTGVEVAVKTLRRIDRRAIGALRREIRTLATLRHPGIVEVVDHGTSAQALPWVALAWLRGQDLRAYLTTRRKLASAATPTAATAPLDETAADVSLFAHTPLAGFEATVVPDTGGAVRGTASPIGPATPLALREALPPLVQVALTLGWLHGEGIVHRDIKPGNIVVEPDGRAVLVDFGIAATAPGATLRERFTADVLGIGTPTYMAPEQITGRHVDARADLYALGVVLYEIFAGRAPFVGSVSEVAHGHVEQTPTPLDELAPGLPAELLDLVADLLERVPSRRPGYAVDVACRLAALCGLPTNGRDLLAHFGMPEPQAYLYRPVFTGRGEVVAAFDAGVEALGQGQGRVLLVEGDAGLGRTRLLIELTERLVAHDRGAERRPRLLRGRCREGVGGGSQVMLGALFEALEPVIDGCRDDPDARHRVFGAEGPVLATSSRAIAELGFQPAPALADPAAQRERVVGALHAVLSRLGDEHGLVLLLDDAHAADAWTAAWLMRLATHGAGPLLVVATTRTESSPDGFAALAAAPGVVHHTLDSLSDAGLHAMVRSMLGLVAEVPSPWIERLASRAGGNPWYLAEYLRMGVWQGAITRDLDGLWQLDTDGPGLAFDQHTPNAVYELMEACFERLGAPARTLVCIVSLHSGHIALDLIEQLADEEVVGGLDEALARGVLEVDDGDCLSLRKAQLSFVVGHYLGADEMRALHTQLASTLHHLGGEDGYMIERGHHWASAGRPEAAWPCLYNAAGEAQGRGELERARALFDAAAELHGRAEGEPVWALRIGRLLAAAEFALGDIPAALARYAALVDQAAAAGEHEEQLHTLLAMASNQQVIGDTRAVDEVLRTASALLEVHDDAAVHVQVLGMRVNQAALAGRTDEAEALAHDALARQRAMGWHAAEAATLSALGDLALNQRYDRDAAQAWYEQALVAFGRCSEPLNEATTLSNLGQLALEQDDLPRAGEVFERALALHQACGHVRGASQVLASLAAWHQRRGDLDETHALLEQSLQMARRCGDVQGVARRLNHLAMLATEADAHDTALAHAAEAMHLARASLPITDLLLVARGYTRCLLRSERIPEALAITDEMLVAARAAGCGDDIVGRLLQECVELDRVSGAYARAARRLRELEQCVERGVSPIIEIGLYVHRALLTLAETPERTAEAARDTERAVACARRASLEQHELVVHGLGVARAALEVARRDPSQLVHGTSEDSVAAPVLRWLRATSAKGD